jgi:hypothetical protein
MSGANQSQATAQVPAFNRKFTVIVRGQLNVEMCSDVCISLMLPLNRKKSEKPTSNITKFCEVRFFRITFRRSRKIAKRNP